MNLVAGGAIGLYLSVITGLSAFLHYRVHGIVNGLQLTLAFFCSLNILICLWELALGYRIEVIQRDFAKLRERFEATPSGRLAAVVDFFLTPLSSRTLFSPAFWSRIWSTYALYDPSYIDKQSFGFWIDVGNGHSTILPSLLWLFGMTYDFLPPKLFAIIGILSFYQEFYGTVIYFSQFIFNKRYQGKNLIEVLLFVSLSNGIWIFIPLIGIWASLRILLDDTTHTDLFHHHSFS
mmetsp:Transcript_7408/g.9404  ORF Transcript_7408/g.9404 Transcript_7408/m.9404 type:complete len:235 (+) Transcript_7408:2-706(+)